jgi:hypothetical protein
MMKRMWKVWVAALLAQFGIAQGFSQRPEEFSVLKFTYLQGPNLYVDEKGIYTDTTLTRTYFNDREWSRANLAGHGKMAFIPLSALNKEDVKSVIGIFGHVCAEISGTYDKKNNKTTLVFKRQDRKNDSISKMLKKVFHATYGHIYNKTVVWDFQKQIRTETSGLAKETATFDIEKNVLKWQDANHKTGSFSETAFHRTALCRATVGGNLDRHATTALLFANCDAGLKRITTDAYTQELTAVSYEK